MKHFRHLLTALLMLCTTTVLAHDFEVDGIYYKIISANDLTVEVTYKGNSYNQFIDEYRGEVIIPETIVYKSKVLKVTSIGEGAFDSCSELTSITIPSSVTSIGKWAFGYCTSLKEVTCLATIPPTCGDLVLGEYEIFYGVNVANIPLYVPAESIELYKKADHWKDFGQILPIEDLNKSLIGEWQYVGYEDKDYIVSICDSLIYNHPFDQSHRYTASASQLYLERLWALDDGPDRWEACNYSFNGDTLWIDNFWMGFMWVTVYPPILYDITLVRKKDVANDVDSPTSTSPFSKTLHNGQLLIFRDDKTYNIMGVEITK